MIENQVWLGQQHVRLRENIQRAAMSFAIAQEWRNDIALLWNDACAREVNGRFLGKMAEQAASCLNALELEHEMLMLCATKLETAQLSFITAIKASGQLHAQIENTAAALRTIQTYLDRSTSEARAANDHVTKAYAMAAAADQAGNSAAPRSGKN